ncbi:MAG: BolA/IbaG family iron-sulfur metabolism protein [Deltaproteobacteria bacterium]|jgi:stress-induced morphogen|nr:BolA/IbaG family iron-sulfur metabolism protein [Deltaproteobacteria bacterium]
MTQDELLLKLKSKYPQAHIKVHSEDNVHFEVYIESSSFAGLSRIEQHQQVMMAVDQELKSGELHAIAIKTKII